MSKHTPGPWKVERRSVLIPIAPYEWAEAYGGTEANARLIAAAPELLEACKVALGIIGFGAEHDQISAAIAKATGEQP